MDSLALQPQLWDLSEGQRDGKNSFVWNSMLLNSSQGSSDEDTHSLWGMQKSYAGISICTFLSSCTMVNIPIDTSTCFSPSPPLNSPPYLRIIASGIRAGVNLLQLSVSFAASGIGSAT